MPASCRLGGTRPPDRIYLLAAGKFSNRARRQRSVAWSRMIRRRWWVLVSFSQVRVPLCATLRRIVRTPASRSTWAQRRAHRSWATRWASPSTRSASQGTRSRPVCYTGGGFHHLEPSPSSQAPTSSPVSVRTSGKREGSEGDGGESAGAGAAVNRQAGASEPCGTGSDIRGVRGGRVSRW
jgi:hypothetical protein